MVLNALKPLRALAKAHSCTWTLLLLQLFDRTRADSGADDVENGFARGSSVSSADDAALSFRFVFSCACSLVRPHCSGCPFPSPHLKALGSATQGQARDRELSEGCARQPSGQEAHSASLFRKECRKAKKASFPAPHTQSSETIVTSQPWFDLLLQRAILIILDGTLPPLHVMTTVYIHNSSNGFHSSWLAVLRLVVSTMCMIGARHL
jgi:hypothetical protein